MVNRPMNIDDHDHDHEFDVLAQFVSPRRGAPCRNQNHVTHGLTGMGWPPGSENDRRRVARFTRALQSAVLEAKGEIGIVDAGTIQTAARWERHARLCGRWLRLEAKELTPDQRLNFSRDIGKASESRDRCLRSLGIDRADRDPYLDALLAPCIAQEPTDDPEFTTGSNNAADANVEAREL
jgi:hypothetical protein